MPETKAAPRERHHSAPDSSHASDSVQEQVRREGRDARNVLSFFIPNEIPKRNSLKHRSSSRSQSPMQHRRSQSASRGSHSSPRSSLTRSTPFRISTSATSPRRSSNTNINERLSSTAPFTVPESSSIDASSAAVVDAVARGSKFALEVCNNSLDELYAMCADLYKRPIINSAGTPISHPMVGGSALCSTVIEMLESAKQDFMRLQATEKDSANGKSPSSPRSQARDGSADSSSSTGNRERSKSDSNIKSNIHQAPKTRKPLTARSLFMDSSSDEEEHGKHVGAVKNTNAANETQELLAPLSMEGSALQPEENVLRKYNYSKTGKTSTLMQRLSSPDRNKALDKNRASQQLAKKQNKAHDLRKQNQQDKREKLKAKHEHVSQVVQQVRHDRERGTRAKSMEEKHGKAEGNAQEHLDQKRRKAEQQNQKVNEVSFIKSLESEMKLADFNDKLEGAATLRNQAIAERKGRASLVNERAEAALEKRKAMEHNARRSMRNKKNNKLNKSGSRTSLTDRAADKYYCVPCSLVLLSNDDAARHGKSVKHTQRAEDYKIMGPEIMGPEMKANDQLSVVIPIEAHTHGSFIIPQKVWEERQKKSRPREGQPSKWSVRNKKKKSQRLRKLVLEQYLPKDLSDFSDARQWAHLLEAESKGQLQKQAVIVCNALTPFLFSPATSSSSTPSENTLLSLEKACDSLKIPSSSKSLSSSEVSCIAIAGYALSIGLSCAQLNEPTADRTRSIALDCMLHCFSVPEVLQTRLFVCAMLELARLSTFEFQALGAIEAGKKPGNTAVTKQKSSTTSIAENRKRFVRHSRNLSKILRVLRYFFIDASVEVLRLAEAGAEALNEVDADTDDQKDSATFGKFQALTYIIVSGVVHRLSNVLTKAGSKSTHDSILSDSPGRSSNQLPSPGRVSPIAGADYTLYFEASYFIEALSSFAVHLLNENKPGDRGRYERFADMVESAGFAGLLPLVTSLTLTPFSHNSKSTTNMIGIVSIRILLHAFRAMNMFALGGLKHFQRVTANFRTQLYHSLCALMAYTVMQCHDQKSDSADAKDLLVELVVFCGYVAQQNTDNQGMFRWGHSPTLLETLCNLPATFFTSETDGGCRDVLLPTLLCVTCESDANRMILSKDVSESLIRGYVDQAGKNYDKLDKFMQSRLPRTLLRKAGTFFSL